jgi:hypothetical protein
MTRIVVRITPAPYMIRIDMYCARVCAMNRIVFAIREPVATLLLVVGLGSDGVLGVSKVRAEVIPPLETRKVCADLGSIGTRAKHMKAYPVGPFESYFHKQNEQPNERHRKVVLTRPKARDVTVAHSYLCTIHAQQHIQVCTLWNGQLKEINVREGQEAGKGDVMFKIWPHADLRRHVSAGRQDWCDRGQIQQQDREHLVPRGFSEPGRFAASR